MSMKCVAAYIRIRVAWLETMFTPNHQAFSGYKLVRAMAIRLHLSSVPADFVMHFLRQKHTCIGVSRNCEVWARHLLYIL
jgi:hypothetical protein